MPGPWRLKELVDRSRQVLAQEGDAQGDSRRVRWLPNVRLVRYYTTLGLLDRPLEMRGRTAFYGTRHLLQLLAVKREQLAGKSLQEIQHRLAGLPDRRLRELAGLPDDWEEHLSEGSEDASEDEGDGEAATDESTQAKALDRQDRFWDRAPALPAAPAPDADHPRTQPPPAATPLAGLALGKGAQLILDAELAACADPETLGDLTRPLIEYLESLRGKETWDA